MCRVFRKALTLAARGSYLTSFCLSKVYNQSAYIPTSDINEGFSSARLPLISSFVIILCEP